MKPLSFSIRSLALALVATSLACADNSGGEPPPGTDVALEVPADVADISCVSGGNQGAAALLQSEADVTAWLEGCTDVSPATRAALIAAAQESGDDKKLIGVRVGLGGCTRDWSMMGIYHDDDTLNVWALLHDSSYGGGQAACTDDFFSQDGYWFAAEGDFAAVTDAALVTGVFNPDLPGAPLLPGS